MKRNFRVLAPNLRHHAPGDNLDGFEKVSLTDYVNDLELLIKNLGFQPIIIGYSMGGLLALKLMERGYELDLRRPVIGEKLPTSMSEHDVAVIYGGPPSANDNTDYRGLGGDDTYILVSQKNSSSVSIIDTEGNNVIQLP